uniref:F-box domain-containing protein n=1 Tax=Brassica oleracea var. oleracea TaxID=109376 RepID=A0A0D3B549_BRAOL
MASSSLPPSLERLSLSFPSPQFPSLTPEMEDGEYSSWSELPTELTSSILQRLGAIEVLENAQKVCTSWRRVSKDPAMWRKIVMHNVEDLGYNLDIMYRHAVDRSQGGLVEIEIWDFGTDSLVNYIAYSSGNLRSLKLVKCYLVTDEGLTEALVKLPLFEELEPPKTPQSESGRSRTRLRKFRLCAREVHAPPPEIVATAGPPSSAAAPPVTDTGDSPATRSTRPSQLSESTRLTRLTDRFGVHLSSWRSYIPLLFIAKGLCDEGVSSEMSELRRYETFAFDATMGGGTETDCTSDASSICIYPYEEMRGAESSYHPIPRWATPLLLTPPSFPLSDESDEHE